MITNQSPSVATGEAVIDSSITQEPVIPTQRGTPPNQPTALKRSEQKPILAPWMKNRAELADKITRKRNLTFPSGEFTLLPTLAGETHEWRGASPCAPPFV